VHTLREMTDATAPPMTAEEKERERLANNAKAWKTFHGYHTSSGYPFWDKTPNVCIPKMYGFGFDCNMWAILCCCFCDQEYLRKQRMAAEGGENGAAQE
jgi:hypothetical protein